MLRGKYYDNTAIFTVALNPLPYYHSAMNIVIAIQIVVALLLSLCILLQHRMSGLSATFGGSGATYVQRRGAEKVIYQATIVLSIVFFVLSIVEWWF
ncbi:MAG: preprotein translocase subunit SecG [Candidatus Peribacteria bacterium]|nr:preprotein translocase subunit SecG [Candidatus Peribacteria bacterium]